MEDPGAELARRFLRAYAPTRPKQLAAWAGIAPSHAGALWERAGPLVEVEVDGATAWALAEDEPELTGATLPDGVRLLPNLDPLHASRDRELLVPDPAVRKRVWTALGGPGTVLAGGSPGCGARPRRGRSS